MINFRPSLSQASIVAATVPFAASAFARFEPEPMALAAPGDGPAAFPKAENAWGHEGLTSISGVKSRSPATGGPTFAPPQIS
jgi:hypothetical protein